MNDKTDNIATPPKSKGSIRAAVDNPLLVLGLIFFVLLFLGLPLLWMSRGFSTWAKIGWTIVVMIYSVVFLWCFWLIMVWAGLRIYNSL